MARVHYYLSDARAGEYAQVRMRFVFGSGLAVRCGTNIVVPVSLWSASGERVLVRSGVSPVERRQAVEANDALERLRMMVFDEYAKTSTHSRDWLQDVVQRFHRPVSDDLRLGDLLLEYARVSGLSSGTVRHYEVLDGILKRYEAVSGRLAADSLSVQDLEKLRRWLSRDRQPNTVVGLMKKLRATMAWAERTGRIENSPFRKFEVGVERYADPLALTREERDRIAAAPIPNAELALIRDIFIFQCYVGCRVSDLLSLTKENVTADGCIQYVPLKTSRVKPSPVIVPLAPTAQAIIERYADDSREALLPFTYAQAYNIGIRAVLHLVGIDRVVMVAGKEPAPLWKVASSHLARKTFTDLLFEVTQSDTVVASLTGHAEGSRALKHYRRVHLQTQRDAIEGLETKKKKDTSLDVSLPPKL